MALNIENIVAELKEATILELNDLVKAIEEEFGVSAAAPVAVAAAGGAAAAGRGAVAGDVLLRQPDARERGGGAAERHGAERADQHRDHLPRAVGGSQAGGGQVPAAADPGDPAAGGDRLLRGHRGRGADGEAAEQVQ